MVFKDFRFQVALRVIFIGISTGALGWSIHDSGIYLTTFLLLAVIIVQLFELYRFISKTNRKLTRFLESVKYSDFASGFSSDNHLGKSFKELNHTFNDVLDAFRKARSEKEEHLLYLNTIVEHVSTGLLSYDSTGRIELINATAKRFLGIDNIRNLDELIARQSKLYKVLFDLESGKSALMRIEGDIQLSVQATEIVLRGKKLKLIALQNIQPELQKKELEAWQNLTKVLRHEIMNSMTPIASLTSTLRDILAEDLTPTDDHYTLDSEAVEDLQDGLGTIQGRSQSLIRFIDAYRDYTSIPQPKIKKVLIEDLLEHIRSLLKIQLRKNGIEFTIEVQPSDLIIEVDEELIGQVLINIVKNAIEALEETENPTIQLKAFNNTKDNVQISVYDNGQGIIMEAIEQIFIPFYSTKKTGSGIGLSLSRQIMQLHNGSLKVESVPDKFTEFTLEF